MVLSILPLVGVVFFFLTGKWFALDKDFESVFFCT